jgi:hypothetical protein
MLLIFVADENSPRLHYILNEILVKRLQISYTITDSYDYFVRSKMPKINYSNGIMEHCINIPAHTLLYEENLKKTTIKVEKNDHFLFTFFNIKFDTDKFVEPPKQHLPFDIFSSSFYLLSRYEEYVFPSFDIHNRFKAEESLAFKNNFLQIPLVDYWAKKLGEIIQKQYPQINYQQSNYTEIHTLDIDFAYKYKGLSSFRFFKKAIGNLLKLDFQELKNQFDKNLKDEYDTYDLLIESLKNKKSYFFFLLGAKENSFDKNLSPQSPQYNSLIINILKNCPVGIHPSYYASASKKILVSEIEQLAKITNEKIKASRFHFLKFKLPLSYNYLIECQITHDYSMAYANQIGFRASTCKGFNFFDLQENKAHPLEIFSPCIMDVTLKNAHQFEPKQALTAIENLKNEVKKVGGNFISIWHNSSLSNTKEWANWQSVWLQMVKSHEQ